jgi:hypothetical protein
MDDGAVAQGGRRTADEGPEEISHREWTTTQITLCVPTKGPQLLVEASVGTHILENRAAEYRRLFDIKASTTPTTALRSWISHNLELTPQQLRGEINSAAS